MALSADDYTDAARRLSPRGKIWQTEAWQSVCSAVGTYFATIDTALAALLDEFDPATTDQLLAALERVYGLPDPCDDPPTTTEDRRAALAAKMRSMGRDGREATLVGIAMRAGYTITVDTYTPFMCGLSSCGDLLYDADWAYHADIPEEIPEWLQCLLRAVTPAHVTLSFSGS